MSDGLDVMVLDDDPAVAKLISERIRNFYTWGEVHCFSKLDDTIFFCHHRKTGIAIFVVDVFLGGLSGFSLLDAVERKYPTVYEDTIMISGNANEDVVNMCLASKVNYLLEKPVKPYALQLAVRAITAKYLAFARKLIHNPAFAATVARL